MRVNNTRDYTTSLVKYWIEAVWLQWSRQVAPGTVLWWPATSWGAGSRHLQTQTQNPFRYSNGTLVLGTRDILVRIRILGSVSYLNGTDPGGPKTYGSWNEHWHIYIIFQRIKKLQNSGNQGFSYYFCLMIEGSGVGSVLVINESGCGSRRAKNIRILRILMRSGSPTA